MAESGTTSAASDKGRAAHIGYLALVALCLASASVVAADDDAWSWRLPPGFPPPRVPVDNPMSAAKVDLGRHLFYDVRLSISGAHACATCHRQRLAFTDGRARALGATGDTHPRAAMSLTNVAYNATFNWADSQTRDLESQAQRAFFSRHPIELGLAGGEDLSARLAAIPAYHERFRRAFPSQPRISHDNALRALAAFQRTLISGRSAFDRWAYQHQTDALSPAARRGLALFFSRRLGCSSCHAGFNFSGPVVYEGSAAAVDAFHNTGLYNLEGRGAYPPSNTGLAATTGRPEDMGRFRAPSLRNIAVTAPYMHDGSVATIADVVEHYAAGGRAAAASDGRTNPLKSPRLSGFTLTAEEKADLIAFLHSLSDAAFLTDPAFADPFAE